MKNVPEIWYKAQRVLRTLVQVGIPAFLAFALVLPQIIEALGLPVDSKLRLWLVAVAAGVTAVATAIARIMAIPAVNAWLIRIGLGSVPASAVHTDQAGTFVKRDPKAGSPIAPPPSGITLIRRERFTEKGGYITGGAFKSGLAGGGVISPERLTLDEAANREMEETGRVELSGHLVEKTDNGTRVSRRRG